MVKTIDIMKKLHQLSGKQPASIKMAGSNSNVTVLNLNVNRINAPINRHQLANWIKNQDPSVCCIQKTPLKFKDIYRLKIKEWRKIYQAK